MSQDPELVEEPAYTRTELLRMRDYPDDVINGNHPPTVNGSVQTPVVTSVSVPLETLNNIKRCGCGQPARPGRPTCGRTDCVKNHRLATKRQAYARQRASGNGKAARSAQQTPRPPEPHRGADMPVAPPRDPLEPLHGLMAGGAELLHCMVRSRDGRKWSVELVE